ncbi:hypothetical protein C8R41DRAFT_758793 [Lentinula lateritia]|uniref:Uncharacterized protein n=1 Tax=Lentinula lateritia TaxID=40482 RepID=A0ABQ8VQT5_9AGAR|nr:hypothetical protein C8R41DRAFT_758793 [Lentinula lateritia]
MGSSELSDALNPYFTQPRGTHSSNANYSEPLQPVMQPSQQYVPHRSELELAISELPATRHRGSFEGHDAIQELLRVVTQTSQAQENERKRRQAWEQEQEERYSQRQAELERQMLEMQREIYSLRSAFTAGPSAPTPSDLQHSSDQFGSQAPRPATTRSHGQYYSPISPVPQISDPFNQGSSSSPIRLYNPSTANYPMSASSQYNSPMSPAPSSSSSPLDSPMIMPGSDSPIGTSALSPELPSDKGSNNDDWLEDPAHIGDHYQRKCRSIQEAMRRHMLRLMDVGDNQNLPDSQPEGTIRDPSQPIRFVWEKTMKQSVHNIRMKSFVLEDIKQNRQLYNELPDRDFSKNILESAFDQGFTYLRQKFKSQRDVKEAENMKFRGDQRAQNARRLARRKKKLDTRAAARLRIPNFERATFDGALQLECMSSEESDDADVSKHTTLYTRGYLWRSSRLLHFFHALDQEDMAVPKRGSAKMNRAIGTPKESIGLPPKGVSSWMISRRWIRATQVKQPDLSEALERLVCGSPNLPPETVFQLGEESEEEEEHNQAIQDEVSGQLHIAMPQHYSSSLHNALA